MLLRLTLGGLLALVPAIVLAQDPTNQTLLDELKLLKEDIQAVKDLAGRVAATEQEIIDLNVRLDQLTTVMNSQDEELRQIVGAISTTDPDGQYIPDILSNMEKSPRFKQDVSDAVHKSLQTEGTFVIDNKTNLYQQIWVNKKEYGVNAGQQLTLNKIPVGTVTTQLPGQKLENWTLGAPNYDEKIEIVPTATPLTTVYRPLTSVYSPVTSVYSPVPSVYSPVTSVYSPVTSVYSPPVYANPTTYSSYYYYRPLRYRSWYRPWFYRAW